MKQPDLSATIGVLANAEVLAGVLLLVYELNQSRSAMEAQMRSDLSEQVMTMIVDTYLEHPELMQKAERGDPLTDDEMWMFLQISIVEFRYHENAFYQYEQGLYEKPEYLAQRQTWKNLVYSQPHKVNVWCSVRSGFSPRFVAEIESTVLTSRSCG